MSKKILKSIESNLYVIRVLVLEGVIVTLLHNSKKEDRDTKLLKIAGVINLLALIIHYVKELYELYFYEGKKDNVW